MDIQSLIKSSGKSRDLIARQVGISQAYLSLLENGHRKVSMNIVGPLAAALGVEPHILRPDLYAVFAQGVGSSTSDVNELLTSQGAVKPDCGGAP